MKIIRSIKGMHEFSRRARLRRKSLGLVPTMGALHAGHVSLIRRATRDNNLTVVSIFVNPLQFSPAEDFKRYPRNLKRDFLICKKEGVDILFSPRSAEMYPEGYRTYVAIQDLSNLLCGKYRPGHFRGVATILTKLFNIIQPDIAYFGQKDAQQAIIIKRMTQDLNIPVKIKVMPTLRDNQGLALSSRNSYLSAEEKKDARVLYQALNLARDLIRKGNTNSLAIIQKLRQLINKQKNASIQYISIVDLADLKPVKKIKGKVLIALAVFIGKTRLIDNIIVRKS